MLRGCARGLTERVFAFRSVERTPRLRGRLSSGSLDVAAHRLNDKPHRCFAPLPRYPSCCGAVPVKEACVYHRRHQAGVPRGRRGDRACGLAAPPGCRARRPCSPAPVLGPRARRHRLGCYARWCEHQQGMSQLYTRLPTCSRAKVLPCLAGACLPTGARVGRDIERQSEAHKARCTPLSSQPYVEA